MKRREFFQEKVLTKNDKILGLSSRYITMKRREFFQEKVLTKNDKILLEPLIKITFRNTQKQIR